MKTLTLHLDSFALSLLTQQYFLYLTTYEHLLVTLPLVYRAVVNYKKQTLLRVCTRPTRVPNWCNDGERERFPFLPTSWWLCSEGPGGRQFIMCPSPLALSLDEQAGTCVHELLPPTLPPTKHPSVLCGDFIKRGERTSGIRVLKSIKVHIYFVHLCPSTTTMFRCTIVGI